MPGFSVELTNACPWRCLTCLPSSGVRRRHELPAGVVARLVTTLAEAGFDAAYYTGGEPVQRDGFAAILRAGAAAGLAQSVVSSGEGLAGEPLRAVAGTGSRVVVSLDAADPAVHDAVRGAGSHRAAVAAVRRCVAAGVPVGLSCTVSRPGLDRLDELVELAGRLGVGQVTFSEVIRGGRARANWAALGLDATARHRLVSWFEHSPLLTGPASADDRCWVDGSSLYVTSEGRAYLCSEIFQHGARHSIGVLSGDPVADGPVLRAAAAAAHGHRPCRYDLRVRGPHVLVTDSARGCSVLELLEVRQPGRALASVGGPEGGVG